MSQRKPKKSESIEIRVSHEVKEAFMSKASREGRSVSEILRQGIAQYLAGKGGTPSKWLLWKPAFAMGSAAVVLLFAYNISSPASAAPELRPWFERLDKNKDGLIEPGEYAAQSTMMITSEVASDGQFTALITEPSTSLASSWELRGDFAGADTNRDTAISFKEFVAYRDSSARRGFAIADRDANGRLVFDEYRLKPGVPAGEMGIELFRSKDANHDGFLSEDEL